MIGVGGLRVAGVVVKAVERVRVEAGEEAAGIVIFDGRGELVAGRERLRAAVDIERREYTADTQIARAQQRRAAREAPARAQAVAALRLETEILPLGRILGKEDVVERIVLLQLLGQVDLHVLPAHVEHVGGPLRRTADRQVLEAALQTPERLGAETALLGQDLRADIETAALVTARQRHI